jgi:hypothetical protein
MYKKFKKIEIEDQVLSRLQDNVEQAIGLLPSTEILQGRLVKSVALLSASTVKVPHKLGRPVIGWIIVRKRGNATVWDAQDSNPSPSLTLDLNCSSNVTVDLWVF